MEVTYEYDDTIEDAEADCSSTDWTAKRRRLEVNNCNAAKTNNKNDADPTYYNEILEGHVNEQIRNSWLRRIWKVSKAITATNSDPMAGSSEEEKPNEQEGTKTSQIQTLSRQLLQVKRRLWPAAEQCARVCCTTPSREFTEARRMCNPMEPLGEGRGGGLNRMFMNRSAIKLVNIDAMLDFTLTQDPTGQEENFLFADLSSGSPRRSPSRIGEHLSAAARRHVLQVSQAIEDIR